ncbi:MAG: DUF721 domain-containing protein [Alphaproteobacteria bacterium]|nr:DUF721 domain-containing protein [Alphaproteobacteria bacterium]
MTGGKDVSGAKPGARRRRGLATLGQSVERITTTTMRRRGFAEAAIATRWQEIVGRPLGDHSRPFRVVFPRGARRGGTLHLTVSGAFAPEIQHLAPQIIERINGFFGYGAVDRLELHHGRVDASPAPAPTAETQAPVPPPAADAEADAAIDKVEDEALRSALRRLAGARAGRAKSKP